VPVDLLDDSSDSDSEISIDHALFNTKDTIDAVLLPWDETTPRIVTLPRVRSGPDDVECSCGIVDLKEYLGRVMERLHVYTMGALGPPLEHKLVICCRESFAFDGSFPNQCIDYITNGRTPTRWAGNVVVMKDIGYDCYVDASLADLTAVVLFLIEYGSHH